MRCLITGATGFLGANVVRAAVAAGHDVRATGAPNSTTAYIDDLPVTVELADLTRTETVAALVNGMDAVIHLAGDTSTWSRLAERRLKINVHAADTLARTAASSGVRRFVHCSTMDVLGVNDDGSPIDEGGGHRQLTGIGYDYAETKLEGQRRVLNARTHTMDVVVVYPGIFIGPFDHTLQLGRVILDMRHGKRTVSPPGTSSFCHVHGVADAIVAALGKGRDGHGYLLGGINAPYHDIFLRMATLLHASYKPVRLSRAVISAAGATMEMVSRLTHRAPSVDRGLAHYMSAPQGVISDKAITELGYDPGSVDQAILDAAAWYTEQAMR